MGNAEQLVIVSTKWDDEWVSQRGGGERREGGALQLIEFKCLLHSQETTPIQRTEIVCM